MASHEKGVVLPHSVLRGHSDEVTGVAFSPDGSLLASCSSDQSVKLWDVHTGKVVRSLPRFSIGIFRKNAPYFWSVAFSPDGSLVAGGSDGMSLKNKRGVNVWHVQTGREMCTLDGVGVIHSIAFSPDGFLLASGASFGWMRIWHVQTGGEIMTLHRHGGIVWSVAFSPDGSLLASGAEDGLIKIWDTKTGTELHSFDMRREVNKVAFMSNNTLLAVSSTSIQILNFKNDISHKSLSISQYIYQIRGADFSPDFSLIVVGTRDHQIMLIDTATGIVLQRIVTEHEGGGVAFSPDGSLVASASYDNSVRLWSVQV